MITVTSPAAGLSLIESGSNIMENHQSDMAPWTMGILLGRPSKAYVASFLANPILFNRYLSLTYASIAPYYLVCPWEEEPNPNRWEKIGSSITNFCISKKLGKKRRRKRWREMRQEAWYTIWSVKQLIHTQRTRHQRSAGSSHDNLVAQIQEQELVKIVKIVTKKVGRPGFHISWLRNILHRIYKSAIEIGIHVECPRGLKWV